MGQGKIAIIGAGPAGMACALELYKANKNFVVIEKENCVGGLSKTYSFGKFKTDNGPHRFFSKNKYLYEMIESLLGEKWIKVNRFTRFYIDGKFYKYPIEPLDVISKISPLKATKIMFDYVKEKLKPKRDPKNFEDYIVSKFGKTLAEFNILNYTEKVWGLKCSELSWEWGEQRIKGLSIKALLKNAFFKGNKPKTLVDQFFYPELGTGMIYEAIREKVETKNKFIFNVVPEKIFVKEKKVEKIVLSNGSEIINPSWVISSIPITELCKIVYPKPSEKVFVASSKLKFRSQVYLFITINKPSVAKDQWIYFPNKEIPLGRISEMRNFSKKMAPENKTSLFIEFFCWKNDSFWKMEKEELLSIASHWLEKLGLVKNSEILDSYLLREEFVYPVYDLDYKKNLSVVLDYFDSFDNLICIGRPGRFKYTNQDHSLEMGILAARSIIEGKKYEIDKVGSEKDYFEKWQLYSKESNSQQNS